MSSKGKSRAMFMAVWWPLEGLREIGCWTVGDIEDACHSSYHSENKQKWESHARGIDKIPTRADCG